MRTLHLNGKRQQWTGRPTRMRSQLMMVLSQWVMVSMHGALPELLPDCLLDELVCSEVRIITSKSPFIQEHPL